MFNIYILGPTFTTQKNLLHYIGNKFEIKLKWYCQLENEGVEISCF